MLSIPPIDPGDHHIDSILGANRIGALHAARYYGTRPVLAGLTEKLSSWEPRP
jgi:hypothetical protein